MDGFQARRDNIDDPAIVTERVLDEARRTYVGLDAGLLERIVQEVVADLWDDSIRVTSFVPVLAMRRIREVVETQGIGSLAAVRQPA